VNEKGGESDANGNCRGPRARGGEIGNQNGGKKKII